MNEQEVAGRIVARLDQELAELPASTVQKLQAARRAALAAHRPSAPDNRKVLSWLSGHPRTTRWVVPAAVVVASLTGLIYWQVSSHHDEELDTGLLAGELPIHAYTDPGFETWLKHSQYEQSQQ